MREAEDTVPPHGAVGDAQPVAVTPDAARRREPAFNLPGVIVLCCVLLLGLHGLRYALRTEVDDRLIAALAFLPARATLALHLLSDEPLQRSFEAAVGRNAIVAEQIQFLLGDGALKPWTFASYALLHATWAHVGFNCVWLVAFGSAVARRFSAARFLALMVSAAVAGAVVQWLGDLASFQLVIGASAAVSGAMGAAVRFVFRPDDEPRRIFDRAVADEAFQRPALSLRQCFTNRTALLFILFWFGTNLLFGLFPALAGVGDGPIAWKAHIGGFLAGLLLFPIFDPARWRASPPSAGDGRSAQAQTA